MKLETTRLLIRPISPDDKHSIFEYRSDAEANKYQGWIPKTPDDVELFITKVAKLFNEPETWFQMAIIEKESQKLIGDMGIHFFSSENKQVELGITLNKAFQRKGYATEALKAIIEYLFVSLKKHRITASIDPSNTSSIRLVERLGFRKEAHFVESVYLNGIWVDDLVFALLEKDMNL